MLNCRIFIAAVAVAGLIHASCQCAGQIDHSGLDQIDAGFRPLRIPASAVQKEDRHHREGGGVGTGQALDTGWRGDADVVFVHAKSAEEKFLAEGQGVQRFPVMYNDFVLIGPKSDPADIKGMKDVAKAFQTIKEKQASFISRGDRSGTHSAELKLWKDSDIDIEKTRSDWYKSIGQGMGAALNTAKASEAYVLSDRGTWIHFKNKSDLKIVVEGDKRMFNQYGVILVNPQKCPNVKADLGQQFVDWVVSPDGQKTIANYKIDGEQLFYPNANEPGA